MAVEVDLGEYIFEPVGELVVPTTDTTGSSQATKDAYRARKAARKAGNTKAKVEKDHSVDESRSISDSRPTIVHVFRYNTLHDFESLLWIAIYFVTNTERRLASDPADTSLNPTKSDREIAAKLFYNVDARSFAMTRTKGIIEQALIHLPTPMRKVGEILAELKATLVGYYQKAEKNPSSIGKSTSVGLHGTFSNEFNRIGEELDKIGDVIVVPIKAPVEPSKQAKSRAITTGSKRRAADELSTCSKKQKSSQNTA